jgi:hypothetical protein
MTMIELITALTVWYIIFAIATDDFNPLKWNILPKILAICVAVGFMILTFN